MKNRNLSVSVILFCGLAFNQMHAQKEETLIKNYLQTSLKSQLSKKNLESFVILNTDASTSMDGKVVNVQQTYNGIPIYNATGTFLIKNEQINYFSDHLVKNFTTVDPPKPALTQSQVAEKFYSTLKLKAKPAKILNFTDKDLTDGTPFAKAQKIYYKTNDGILKLAYQYEFEEHGTPNYWLIVADANSGEVLEKNNLTVSDNFHKNAYRHLADSQVAMPTEKLEIKSNHFENIASAVPSASYNVFALPAEAPSFAGRTLLTNPWLLDASPNGWQQDNSATYSYTRGNNVYAYNDINDQNYPNGSPDGGATGTFNFPFKSDGYPSENLDAATTNLFYINNRVHDIFYRFGFTETSRNFQSFNFGKGGLENDYVQAESQDGGGKDNANFSTPSDGSRPRMQMYLWQPAEINRLFYNAPASAVNRLPGTFSSTTFGAQLNAIGVTADVKLGSVTDGCTALTPNSLVGKIGLVIRGGCNFTEKAKNIQNAGGIGAIIYNAPNSAAIGAMGGTDASVTIPAILIENSEGEYIKSQLNSNVKVNVTLKFDENLVKYRDGSFDNGIVTHEYGHGISNRLSPTAYCLQTGNDNEQMGEGWSDFFALMLTNQPGATAANPRSVGTYAVSQSTTGRGIRPALFSPDFSINNYTYGKSNDVNFSTYVDENGNTLVEPHQIGFLWTTMLWDLHWKYVEKYGYESDLLKNNTNGSTRALQMVVNGIKLEGCNPSFVAGRDAILAADQAATGGKDRCMIWRVFAKRGLGVNASPGLIKPQSTYATSVIAAITDQIEDFTIPTDCSALATDESNLEKNVSIYPNPAKDHFNIKLSSAQLGKLSVEIFDAAGKLVSSDKIEPSESISTTHLVNGIYIVKVKGLGLDFTSKLLIAK